jgi:phosphoglucosamine mutase
MKNIFGTDGIRDKIHHGALTTTNLTQLGHAIGQWATNNFEKPIKILIGYDTRSSCSLILETLTNSILQYPIELFNGKILPTPVVCKLVKEEEFDIGIIISASHNSAEYNGIKIVKKDSKISALAESAITQLYQHETFNNNMPKNNLQTYHQASQLYQIFITAWFEADFLEGKKIVLDCAHGATYKIAPKIFEHFGAEIVCINNSPDGHNINLQCGSTCPKNISDAVFVHQADWGISFDGDGDRVIIVDKNGHTYDGDDILAVLTHHPLFKKSPVVGTIMSNQGLGQYLQEKNKIFFRASVGDKHVYQMMQQYHAMLGGEPSGHVIVEPFSYSGDGIFTALLFIETIIKEAISIPLFKKFHQISNHIQITNRQDLKDEPYATIIKKYETILNPGRLIVRYSGTEPILRIMVESDNQEIATQTAFQLQQEFESILS